jgi:hypothetical protein
VELPFDGQAVRAVAVLRNGTGADLQHVCLSAWVDANITVKVDPPTGQSLPAHGDLSWSLILCRGSEQAPLHGKIYLRVDYNEPAEKEKPATKHMIFGTIEPKEPDTESIDPVAEAQIQTDLEALNNEGRGWVYLVLTSKTRTPLSVVVAPNWGDSIEPSSDPNVKQPTIQPLAPHATELIAYPVQTKQRVVPGKELIVFDIGLSWGPPAAPLTRRLVATKEVNVGVLGEAAILTVLGVPTLLFLPGFLILVTVQLLWDFKVLKSKHDSGQFTLEAKSAPFWMLAVTLSMPVLLGYRLWIGRQFPRYYNLADLVTIWFASLVLGGFSYAVVMLVRNYSLGRRSLSEGDEALDVLKKLPNLGLGTSLTRYNLGTAAAPQNVFLFEPPDEHREMSWIGPAVEVRWDNTTIGGLPADQQAAAADLDAAIQAQFNLGDQADPAALADAFRQARDQGFLTIAWGQVGPIDRLTERKTDGLTTRLAAASIINYHVI